MTAGESIRAAREALGWSQSDLAREAGIGQDTVSDIERGKTNPSRGSLDKIRAVLDFEEPDVTTTESEPREFTKDEPPRARKAGAAKKAAPKKTSGAIPPLSVQLQVPYKLAATGLRTRLPVTAQVIDAQAGPCAAAWDQFLLRYPGLRDKIEQGAVAADIVNLVMVHLPILQIAREELANQQQAAQQTYDGGLGAQAA